MHGWLLTKNEKNIKKMKNPIDFECIFSYNSSCVENTDAQPNKECAFSSVGRAPDS